MKNYVTYRSLDTNLYLLIFDKKTFMQKSLIPEKITILKFQDYNKLKNVTIN